MLKPHLQNAPRWPLALLPLHLHLKHQSQVHQRRMRRNPRCKSRRSLIGTLSSHIEFLPSSDLPSSMRRLKKECKSDNVKFQGSPKTIKIDEVWEQSEFEAIFSGKGTLIQPTPDNKPKSTVTIIHFVRSPLQSLHTSLVDHFFHRRRKPKSKNSSVASWKTLKATNGLVVVDHALQNHWSRAHVMWRLCRLRSTTRRMGWSVLSSLRSLKWMGDIAHTMGRRREGGVGFDLWSLTILHALWISFCSWNTYCRFVIILKHRSLLYHIFICI